MFLIGYILDGSSSDNPKTYLNSEFYAILKDCSPETMGQIYEIATIIAKKK